LEKCFKEWQPAPVAIDFLGLFHATELHKRLPPRLCGIHARAQIVFDVHLEMAFHLGGKLVLSPLSA
jgi:hypothetical protein